MSPMLDIKKIYHFSESKEDTSILYIIQISEMFKKSIKIMSKYLNLLNI